MSESYVVGVGAANVDVHARSRKAIKFRDSNPGSIHLSAGGVSRNVSENLARLGARVVFLSAVGDDAFGDVIRTSCERAGIDASGLYVCEHPSSTYLSILDENGDMQLGLSDMSILKALPPEYLEGKRAIIEGARAVTCDPSLSREVIEQLLGMAKCPVYVDPVSTAYAAEIKDIIGRFHTAKPNEYELEILSGMPVKTDDDLRRACEKLISRGLKRVLVSLGANGCFYMDEREWFHRRLLPLKKLVNATGGGDAFMAAVIYASAKGGMNATQTADFALAAGYAAVSADMTINPDMSENLVIKTLQEYKQ